MTPLLRRLKRDLAGLRGRVAMVILAACAAIAIAISATGGAGGDDGQGGEPSTGQGPGELLSQIDEAAPDEPTAPARASAEEVRDPSVPSFEIARMLDGAHVDIYDEPDGEVVKTLGPKTEFGSDRTFYLAKR